MTQNKQITVLVDTREQRNMNILNGFQQLGISWKPCKLEFGDYSFAVGKTDFRNICVIERKMSLTELSGNFCKGRIRFETEFAKALVAGCKVTLLVEDEKAKAKMLLRKEMDGCNGFDLEKKYSKTWRSDFSGNSMIGSIKAFKDRYNLDLLFCKKADTAKNILKIFNMAIEEAIKVVSDDR